MKPITNACMFSIMLMKVYEQVNTRNSRRRWDFEAEHFSLLRSAPRKFTNSVK